MNDLAESAALGFLRKKARGTSTTIQRNKCQHVRRFFLSIYLTPHLNWRPGTAKTAERPNRSLVGSCGLLYTETVVSKNFYNKSEKASYDDDADCGGGKE